MIQAVITGDVIHSTRMSMEHREWLFSQISDALKQWSKDFGMKSETFRGDSFQCLVKRPAEALKMALLLKTFIRSLNPTHSHEVHVKNQSDNSKSVLYPTWIFDARIAIGMGEAEWNSKRLATSGGGAFQLSGQLLDSMKNRKHTLAISTDDSFNEELATELVLLDAIISRTTALQCEVINYKLLGYTELDIAQLLNIGQSAVNQRSNSGNWNAMEYMLKRFERIYAGSK